MKLIFIFLIILVIMIGLYISYKCKKGGKRTLGGIESEEEIMGYTTGHILKMMEGEGTLESDKDDFMDKIKNWGDKEIDDLKIWTAATYGHDELKLVIDKGFDVNSQGINGHTILHQIAIQPPLKRHPKIIKMLLKHGADPLIETKYGETAIDIAKKHNNVVFNLLTKLPVTKTKTGKGDFGAINLNKATNEQIKNLDPEIASMYNLSGLKAIIKAGYDVNTKSKINDATILHYVCQREPSKSSLNAAKFLLDLGARYDIKAWSEQETALDLAEQYNKPIAKLIHKEYS